MNTKWYIGTLLIVLTFIGLNREQNKSANQQIVFQFTEGDFVSETAHKDALKAVTIRLKALGITDIEVQENDSAQLRILYYSDIDALRVEEFLSGEVGMMLLSGDTGKLPLDFPEDELPEDSFSLVVSDLHQNYNDVIDSNGKLANELSQDFKRFSNPIVLHLNGSITLGQNAIVQVALKVNKTIVGTIDNRLRSIPEVRAGPLT